MMKLLPFLTNILLIFSTLPFFPISHFKINKGPWLKFNKSSFIIFFLQSSFDSLSFSDPNLFLTAFNGSFLESLDAVLPTKTSFFCPPFSKASWFVSQCFSAKRAFQKLERLYSLMEQMAERIIIPYKSSLL